MKMMERFGTPILSYEGACQGAFMEENYRLNYSGYFEAAQYASGRMVIGIMTTGPLQPSSVGSQSSSNPRLTFAGISSDGWAIKCIEQTTFNRISWVMAPMVEQPNVHLISARRFETSYRDRIDEYHYGVTFLISNFLWHDSESKGPEPIELGIRGFRIIVTPVEGYQTAASQLISGGGVQPTAWVHINCAGGPRQSLKKYASILDDLLCVFRLVTGNEVSWYYGEARAPYNQLVARIHNYSSPMPYSNTVRLRYVDRFTMSLIRKLDLGDLVMAYFDQSNRTLDKAILEKLVNQFTNATNTTPYLESSALLASTLTEMIASTFASARGKSNVIRRDLYRNNIRPTLKNAINYTGLSEEIQRHLRQALSGVRRRTFGDKIRLMCDEWRLPLSEDDVRRIVRIRNELVHRGTFPSVAEGSNWRRDYNFIVRINLMLLSRLMGYGGGFTEQLDQDKIEV